MIAVAGVVGGVDCCCCLFVSLLLFMFNKCMLFVSVGGVAWWLCVCLSMFVWVGVVCFKCCRV